MIHQTALSLSPFLSSSSFAHLLHSPSISLSLSFPYVTYIVVVTSLYVRALNTLHKLEGKEGRKEAKVSPLSLRTRSHGGPTPELVGSGGIAFPYFSLLLSFYWGPNVLHTVGRGTNDISTLSSSSTVLDLAFSLFYVTERRTRLSPISSSFFFFFCNISDCFCASCSLQIDRATINLVPAEKRL